MLLNGGFGQAALNMHIIANCAAERFDCWAADDIYRVRMLRDAVDVSLQCWGSTPREGSFLKSRYGKGRVITAVSLWMKDPEPLSCELGREADL